MCLAVLAQTHTFSMTEVCNQLTPCQCCGGHKHWKLGSQQPRHRGYHAVEVAQLGLQEASALLLSQPRPGYGGAGDGLENVLELGSLGQLHRHEVVSGTGEAQRDALQLQVDVQALVVVVVVVVVVNRDRDSSRVGLEKIVRIRI